MRDRIEGTYGNRLRELMAEAAADFRGLELVLAPRPSSPSRIPRPPLARCGARPPARPLSTRPPRSWIPSTPLTNS